MIVDRYQEHGLWSNPFAIPARQQGRSAAFVDRGLPDPPPPGSSTLVQVIGDKGFGKSTQLAEWQATSPAPYHYVPFRPYRSRWTTPPVRSLVYGDEIDRMPVLLQQRWFRQLSRARATVVIGTHVDLGPLASSVGLHVVTHRLEPANLPTVSALLRGHIERVAIDDSPVRFRLDTSEIQSIHHACRGSLRTAEVVAHELVAHRVAHYPAGAVSTKAGAP